MDRLACIRVPSLALQVALRRFPGGHKAPLALVKEDKPTSAILHLNKAARAKGLRLGMRYSEALSLVSDLKAVTVGAEELAAAQADLLGVLVRWSPLVEVCPFDPSFWVGAGGLGGLFGTEAQWGASLRAALASQGFHAVVVVGLTRGGTYVLARSRGRSTVVLSPEAESRAFETAPLSLFPLTARHQRLLETLGLTTLAQVMKIPAEELGRRFGPDLIRDLRQLETLAQMPLQSISLPSPLVRHRRLEVPVSDRQALAPLVVEPLQQGLDDLNRRARLLSELRLVFVLESGALVSEVLKPAEPTTHRATLVRLLELRLERCVLPEAVVEIRLAFAEVDLPSTTGELFAPPLVREPRRGAEALALIRAQWGNDAVVHPVLADSHIPELSFRWEPVETLTPPRPRPSPTLPLTAVRRIPWRGAQEKGNPAGQRLGTACRLKIASGPLVLDKDYWFLRTGRREVAWVSWNRVNQSPRWEGMVD